MSDARLDTDLTARDRQPIVAFDTGLSRTAATHHVQVANVFANRPFARVIYHERIQLFGLRGVLKRAFLVAFDLAHLQRVGLPHDDENFYLLGHVGRFAVGIRKWLRVLPQERIRCGQQQGQNEKSRSKSWRVHQVSLQSEVGTWLEGDGKLLYRDFPVVGLVSRI